MGGRVLTQGRKEKKAKGTIQVQKEKIIIVKEKIGCEELLCYLLLHACQRENNAKMHEEVRCPRHLPRFFGVDVIWIVGVEEGKRRRAG
jgi:hypothetical protein